MAIWCIPLTFLAFPCLLKHTGSQLASDAAIGPFEDMALILLNIDHKTFRFESCSKPEQAGIATHNPD